MGMGFTLGGIVGDALGVVCIDFHCLSLDSCSSYVVT